MAARLAATEPLAQRAGVEMGIRTRRPWLDVMAEPTPRARILCILGMVGLGIALSLLLGLVYRWLCPWPRAIGGVCWAVTDKPPWTLLTSVAAAPALVLTWWWRTVHKDQDLANKQHEIELAKREEWAKRFAVAVSLIADDKKIDAKVGGIYLLESLASDSERHRSVVIDTLCAFVRNHAIRDNRAHNNDEDPDDPDGPRAPADIEATCQVLARLPAIPAESRISLRCTDLTYVRVPDGSLAYADLTEAWLANADLQRTDLTGARLRESSLMRARLTRSRLVQTDLSGASIQTADLTYADLRGANLTDADLRGANLTDADLSRADFRFANLSGANLVGTKYTRNTLLPADFDPGAAGMILVDNKGKVVRAAPLQTAAPSEDLPPSDAEPT